MANPSKQTLYLIAQGVRDFLEPIWPQWHAARGTKTDILSRWTCGRSSLLLQRVYEDDFGMEARWVCGTPRYDEDGPELGPYGFLHNDRWQSHAWVEAGDYVVDVTADQFEAAPVIVSGKPDFRYGEGPADTASADSIARRHQTVAELLPLWLTSDRRKKLVC